MKPQILLVTRADDAGSCRSANYAIWEGVEAGIIKNVSFMAVGPQIEHAAELLGGRDDIAYGFHICLNAEWETVKWKPLTRSPRSILTDENGDFLPHPAATKAQAERVIREEMEQFEHCPEPADLWHGFSSEIRAQYNRLRDLGLPISYVDDHMGVSQIGLRSEIEQLCRFNGLVDAHFVPALPHIESSGDPFADLEARLKSAMLSRYVWVTHPGQIAPDMNRFHLPNQPPGEVARERDAERGLLTDERLPRLFQEWRVKLCRYDEVLAPL